MVRKEKPSKADANHGTVGGHATRDEHPAAEDKSGATAQGGAAGKAAAGANIKLSAEQRTIRTTVLQGGPRVNNVNFDVTVGTVVPRGSVEIVAVPATLVEIEPQWRASSSYSMQVALGADVLPSVSCIRTTRQFTTTRSNARPCGGR